MTKLLIKRAQDLNILKTRMTLDQLKNKLTFDEPIIAKGLVMILEKELEVTDRCATYKEREKFAVNEM